MSSRIKTRFAPSPTGYLHLGNLRTALFSALYARGQRGDFLLRIEDTDVQRSTTQFTDALLEDLRWLGLDWDEGPGRDGGSAPYFQAQRGSVYERFYESLTKQHHAYPCFCTAQELEIARKRLVATGKAPRYLGTCAQLTPSEVTAKIDAGKEATLRFRVPKGQVVSFSDFVRGPQSLLTDDIGDFIIRRADKTPAFFFCNAVDDALMGVTHVMRGEDHLTNTPRQLLLLAALGLAPPQYGHISMIVGADGAPLSKRTGSRSLRELRAEGFLPLALVNYLARLGHHYEDARLMSLDELAQAFSLDRLGRAPARFDVEQLTHWQREAVARLEEEAFWHWVGVETESSVPTVQRTAFVDAVRHNVTFPAQVNAWAQRVFNDVCQYNDLARQVLVQTGPAFFAQAQEQVDDRVPDFKTLTTRIKDATGAKGKALFHPVRVALTGELDGPEMGKLVALFSPDRLRARFAAAGRIAGTES